MKRLLAIFGMAIVTLVLVPGIAHADDQGRRNITHYAVDASAAKDGVVSVKIDFDFDFADKPGHGPYVTLPLRQGIKGDPDHWRSFTITGVQASSPSGAPTKIDKETDNGALAIKIGNENKEVKGVQSYQLSYRISGVVNPGAGAAGADEIFWNIIGQQWEIPLHNVTMNLTGPTEVSKATCYAGKPGRSAPCDKHQVTADGATFSQDLVKPGSALTVVADWPAGTFVGAQPKLSKRFHPGNMFPATPATGGLAGAIALLGGGALLWRARRKGRDEEYLGLTPGLSPAAGEGAATVGTRSRRAPVAVQFTPPAGVGPGEMGTLADEVADPRDVTATVVDLAVRGYLRIEEITTDDDVDKPDWRLVKLRSTDDLKAYEQTIIAGLFSGDDNEQEVVMSDLGASFAGTLGKTQKALYRQVTDRGWFRANPATVRAAWYGIGAGIIALGALVGIALALTVGWGLVGLGIVVAGIVAICVAHLMPARTAAGTAVLAQSLGFKLYLETAEANQIRFEEGEDIFSRYLPFAIAFDVAERWAKIFADLAAQGRNVPEPSWYVGSQVGYFAATSGVSFASSLSAFSATATTAMTSATAGSSGGSGFSGGAGIGVGGGGGGGW